MCEGRGLSGLLIADSAQANPGFLYFRDAVWVATCFDGLNEIRKLRGYVDIQEFRFQITEISLDGIEHQPDRAAFAGWTARV